MKKIMLIAGVMIFALCINSAQVYAQSSGAGERVRGTVSVAEVTDVQGNEPLHSQKRHSKYVIGYNPVEYKDVPHDKWFYKAIRYVTSRGIASGESKDLFGPGVEVTRGEFIVMIMKAYNIDPIEYSEGSFASALNFEYYGYLGRAEELGLIDGLDEGLYYPGNKISRQEIFVIVHNILVHLDKLLEESYEVDISNFNDSNDIEPWAEHAIDHLVEAGVVSGSRLGFLAPNDTATKAEVAQLIYNLLN